MADEAPAPAPAAPASTPAPDAPVETRTIADPARRGRTAATDTEWANEVLTARRQGETSSVEPDDFVAYDEDRPHFASDAEALQHGRDVRAERERDAAIDRANEDAWRSHNLDQEIAKARTSWSDEDGARGGQYKAWHADFSRRAQEHQRNRQQAAEHIAALARTGDVASAQRYADIVGRQVQAEEQQLGAELAQLNATAQAWAHEGLRKNDNANRLALTRDFPELSDPAFAEDFIERVHRRTGYTKAQIRNFGSGITDPGELERAKSVIGAELRQVKQEQAAEREGNPAS